jgi:hypothetical protein
MNFVGLAMTKTCGVGGKFQTPGIFVIARLADESAEIDCLVPASRSNLEK